MNPLDTSASSLFSWGRYRLPRDEAFRLRLGSLSVFARKQGDEIWISHGSHREGDPPAVEPARQEDWSRWGASESPDEIEILPAFPDRPLVLCPENPFNLLPGARARVFVRVPLWLRVGVRGAKGGLLLEIPTVTLSDTWWGTPELPVQKILLQVGHLTIFRGDGSLWSDEIRVRYKGEAEGSDLEVTGRTPPEAPGAVRLMPPRTPAPRGFTARTFSRIKALPSLGISF